MQSAKCDKIWYLPLQNQPKLDFGDGADAFNASSPQKYAFPSWKFERSPKRRLHDDNDHSGRLPNQRHYKDGRNYGYSPDAQVAIDVEYIDNRRLSVEEKYFPENLQFNFSETI